MIGFFKDLKMSFIGPIMFCALLKEIEESFIEECFNENNYLKKKQQVGKSIIICGKRFSLSNEVINELPYFQNLFSNYEKRYGDSAKYLIPSIDHIDPSLFQVIVHYLENNCKSSILFGHLPTHQSSLMLLQLFDSLLLKPPIKLNIFKIKDLLIKTPREAFQFQDDVIKYAFAIFYCQRNVNWFVETQYRESIIKNLLYILNSKDICFQPRLKFHLKELALNCVIFSKSEYDFLSTLSIDSDSLDKEDIEVFGSVDHPIIIEKDNDSSSSNETFGYSESSYDSVFHSKITIGSEYMELFGKKFTRSNSTFSLCGKENYLSYSSASVLL